MRKWFLIIVLLQAFLLVSIVMYRQHWVNTGTRILLKTEPVDPRDIFRGDYVWLGYEISNLDPVQLGATENFRRNEKVYVLLDRKPDGTCGPAGISKTEPEGKLFIQGRTLSPPVPVSRWRITIKDDDGRIHSLRPTWFSFKKGDRLVFCLNRNGAVMFQSAAGSSATCWNKDWRKVEGIVVDVEEKVVKQLPVEYGIESFFVEEGKGRSIERNRNSGDLKVEVSLRGDGKGIITSLIMDGAVIR